MGSMISLGIDNLEIFWGKNNFFQNHSKLFLPNDIEDVECPYYSAYEESAVYEQKKAYCRDMASVKKRLDLLGYSIDSCRSIYESLKSHMQDHHNIYPKILS